MKRALRIGLVLLVIGAVAVVVVRSGQSLPKGPVPVVWDETACAECRMHVGEPKYAAQLQTSQGDVLDFDDPGCLFHYLAAQHPPVRVHAIYFHDSRGSGWLKAPRVAFVPAEQTPMDYGFAAVGPGTPAAISMDEARRTVLARRTETP